MGEWTGAWSDGSSEWNPYWMKKLNHTFGDDGIFWMSYEDLLKRFELLDRTRIFDKDWTVVQQWTSQSVAWVTGYLNTKFVVEIKQSGPTVFVLSQVRDLSSLRGSGTNNSSSIPDTSKASKASIPSIYISSSKRRVPSPVTIFSELVVRGSAIVAFRPK